MRAALVERIPIYLNKAGPNVVGFDSLEDSTFRKDRPFINAVPWAPVLKKGSRSAETRVRNFKTGDSIPVLSSAIWIDDPKDGRPLSVGNVCSNQREQPAEEKRPPANSVCPMPGWSSRT